MTQAQVFNLLIAAIPNPERVRDLEMVSARVNEIRFQWGDIKFRVEAETLHTEEVRGKMLYGSDAASLLSQLLKKQKQLSDAQN